MKKFKNMKEDNVKKLEAFLKLCDEKFGKSE